MTDPVYIPYTGLTPSFFTKVFQQKTGRDDVVVVHVELKKVPQGVLSNVHIVLLTYDNTTPSSSADCPLSLLAKCPRSDLFLPDMFSVEGAFYTHYATNNETFPFLLPTLFYASPDVILLAYIPNTICFPLFNGCPSDKVSTCLTLLASLHAAHWNKTFVGLADPAGMGAALNKEDKMKLFVKHSNSFLKPLLDLPTKESSLLFKLLSKSSLFLKKVHDKVYKKKWTLIHGDFHIANFLWKEMEEKKGQKEDEDKGPWLIDWGSCGLGNPLVDVAFFLLVSTRVNMQDIEVFLWEYYSILIDPKTTSAATSEIIQKEFTFFKCKQLFRNVLCNQLLIFIAYDPLVRKMAKAAPTTCQQGEQTLHFNTVHARGVQAMLSSFMDWKTFLKTDEKGACS